MLWKKRELLRKPSKRPGLTPQGEKKVPKELSKFSLKTPPVVYTTYTPPGITYGDNREENLLINKKANSIVKQLKGTTIKKILTVEKTTVTKLQKLIEPDLYQVNYDMANGYNPRYYISHLYMLQGICRNCLMPYLFLKKQVKILKKTWTLVKSMLGYTLKRGCINSLPMETKIDYYQFL